MRKIVIVAVGLFLVFLGTGLILPALAKVRDYGSMPGDAVAFYTLGIVIAIGGIALAARVFQRRKATSGER